MKEELRSLFKNKKILIPVIALLFIPVLYSGMFLWAFWDPYGHLQDLPVVVVNDDRGAEFEGEELKLGNELMDKLKESDDFEFHFENKEEAYKGLKEQNYYLLVEIPENFSEHATTLMDEEPQKLDLIYVPNESYNFLASQIGGTAIERIKASLSEKITETYSETIFSRIDELAEGIEKASEGAGQLSEGSNELKEGTNTLHQKLAELASKSIQFQEGMGSAHSGAQDITAGVSSLNDGLGQLEDGHSKLVAASEQIFDGNKELGNGISAAKTGIEEMNKKLPEMTAGTKGLAEGAKNLSGSLEVWKTESQNVSDGISLLHQKLNGTMENMSTADQRELEAILESLENGTAKLSYSAGEISKGADNFSSKLQVLNEKQQVLQQGVQDLADGSSKLQQGANNILAGESEFVAGMATFDEKLAQAHTGASQLESGATKLSGGLGELSQGTDKIVNGAGQLEDGAKKLADGSNKIADGSSELSNKLAEGADEASSVHADDKTFNMIANPVEVQNEKVNEVPNYGTGFAPYFLSLGLFVGALLLTIVFPLREPAAVPRNAWSWFTSKFTILAGVGMIQGLIAAAILIVGLGLEVKSLPLFLLFVMITSLTFMALVQFLVTAFGDPGRFVAILILIFQLTTSAGTFPLELIPGFLQHFNAFLPMTYTVQGFKDVISSGDFASMWHNGFILLGFMVIFMLGSFLYFKMMHKRQFTALVKNEKVNTAL